MHTPTIGIEIELPWRHVLGRVDPEARDLLAGSNGYYSLEDAERARVQQGFDAVDERYKDLVGQFYGEDIEKQHDGYTEFAFTPKTSHERIAEVAERLYDAGVLLDGESYPLHVTLGGIAAKNSSWLILMAAELSGGASAERIAQVNTWSQKGIAGIRPRGARELKLDSKFAIEMRSLEATSLAQLAEVLQTAQTAGSILMAKLAGDASAAATWRELYRHLMASAEAKDIDARVHWKNPQLDHTPWLQLAGAFGDDVWQRMVASGVRTILLG